MITVYIIFKSVVFSQNYLPYGMCTAQETILLTVFL